MGTQNREAAANEWTGWQLALFRFSFAYFLLYSFPFPESFVPGTTWLTDACDSLWNKIEVWVGTHVLRLGQAISTDQTGSGDRICNYVQILCIFVLAVV